MSDIHNNKNYSVVVGEIALSETRTGPGYQLINKETGVCEFETTCLPQILEVAEGWDNKLQSEFHKAYTFRPEAAAQMDLLDGVESPTTH